MKLSPSQVEPEALTALAVEASKLLIGGKFAELSENFGYAIALGRNLSAAIQEDLDASLSGLEATKLDATKNPEVSVNYFKFNENNLLAIVQSVLPTTSGHGVIVELVISAAGTDFYATLEQISAAA